jgi:hypothetical protein
MLGLGSRPVGGGPPVGLQTSTCVLAAVQARLTGLFELWDPPTPPTTTSASSSSSSQAARGPAGGGRRLSALYLRYAFPDHLVVEAGAPPVMWQVLRWVVLGGTWCMPWGGGGGGGGRV